MELIEQDRTDLEKYLGHTLSDKQWGIVKSEIDVIEDDQEASEVLMDIIANLDEYEKEYDFWEELKTSDKTPETVERLLEKYK